MSIGYACITLGVEDAALKRCILKNATEDRLRNITLSNLMALEKAVEYNIENGIVLFRISSDIVPFASHSINKQEWWKEHEDIFLRIGNKIISSGMRVSMHPGQYTVLNSPKKEVVLNAVKDLRYHTKFLDTLGVDSTNKIVLHIGGSYGDKKAAVERFIKNYLSLSNSIKKRLVIENDEKCYSVDDVLKIGIQLGIPVVFDNLHNLINPAKDSKTEEEWIKLCKSIWKESDGRQKIHYSQQAEDGKPGSHSQTINVEQFLEFYKRIKELDVDVMLEVKDKNLSALKCIEYVKK